MTPAHRLAGNDSYVETTPPSTPDKYKSAEKPGRPQTLSLGTKDIKMDPPKKRKKSCAADVREILAKEGRKIH